ncbi:MAG: Gfo/Idh/MocA family oxidoreductase [Paenibacillus sp.]|jgi:predicted dehydrogenase|nr:Gfo/Idh/MocA family oxidoreductase [Paenibacillus sp.]
MSQKLRIGVLGYGAFSRKFVPLFINHPHVEKVVVCDQVMERRNEYSETFGVEALSSYEDLLKSDVNAIAIFTERHSHGPFAIKALKAGKHVYSAVPMASTIEECQEIVALVKKTGLTYMIGETCYYWPCAMYARDMYRKGEFGKFVYGASQYYHDIAHFNYKIKSHEGVPPFFYPTHSIAMLISAVDSHVTRVTAFGYDDTEFDGKFEVGANLWDNTMSNGYSLMKLANGGTARINECRRIGVRAPSSYISGVYGTKGHYEYSNAQHIFVKDTGAKHVLTDASDLVNTVAMTEHKNDPDFKERVANGAWKWTEYAPIQFEEVQRLPEQFKGLPNGHNGSHQLLIDDFCKAAYAGIIPPVNNAWDAARYTIPGLLAHQSALMDGMPFNVPDCGDAPI